MIIASKYFFILLVTTMALVAVGVVHFLRHQKKLLSIPIRIHVNGTRGKSSVTRLIAAGLKAGGIRTCAKTTGTLPRMIMPDGREYPIFRPGRANVAEQVRVVSAAYARQVEALVVECMALLPYLQWLSEAKMIRATHGVITNARADHLDVMGPDEEDVAWALCGMVPQKGKLFTCEQKHLPLIQQVCQDRGAECIALSAEDIKQISSEELAAFSYIEHPDNVALALKVCAAVGVKREVALQGMYQAVPDVGALRDFEINFFGRKMFFVNGFAANDPESTEKVWNIALSRYPNVKKKIAIFNCRVDRPERSVQLAEAFTRWQCADHLIIMGTGTYWFSKELVPSGFDYHSITYADNQSVEEIFELVVSLAGSSSVVVGMGNIGGQGLDLVTYFKNRAVVRED
ncbi:MAG TPA: poly-gamma-glutamate synthase PgsB [bacterium]|nr:poly-gamma-glutamate synthase PgsB [bacterium]